MKARSLRGSQDLKRLFPGVNQGPCALRAVPVRIYIQAMPTLKTTPLTLDGARIAEVEEARSLAERSRGLLGRDGIATGLVLRPASSVHTLGMRFAIDVVYVNKAGLVLAVTTMKPQRMGLPRLRCAWILETEAGRCAEWEVRPGRRLAWETPHPLLLGDLRAHFVSPGAGGTERVRPCVAS